MNEEPNHYHILIPRICSICGGINPSCAKYCGDCGSSFIINKISPDLLHSKFKDSNDPNSDRTGNSQLSIYYNIRYSI